MSVTLGGKLPPRHGLTDLVSEVLADGDLITAVVVIDCRTVEEDRDTGERTVKARLRRLEVIHDSDDLAVVRRLAMRADEKRSGQTVLPFDTEDAVNSAFEGWALDPASGELTAPHGRADAPAMPEVLCDDTDVHEAHVWDDPDDALGRRHCHGVRPTLPPRPPAAGDTDEPGNPTVEHTTESDGYGPGFSDPEP